MGDRTSAQALVDMMYASRLKGDADALAGEFADDAVFRICGFGDTVSGRPAIDAALKNLIARYPFIEFRPIKVVIDGDEIVTRSFLRLRNGPDGTFVETETCECLTIKGGKIAELVQYVDTALVVQLVQH